jgi:RimJ/RimL family protein N-acetyltransferase
MAVRLDGRFIGEAVLYAFDGRGSAEFGVRLLPEWHGKGLGTESVRAISLAARDMGLVRLSARIMKQNRPSVRMLEKVADSCEYGDSEAHFSIDLLKL